jgi:hypothetical protein
MHQNCVYKLRYFKNKNLWKEKHLQKRKWRRGGLPESQQKPVAGSDRSLDSDAHLICTFHAFSHLKWFYGYCQPTNLTKFRWELFVSSLRWHVVAWIYFEHTRGMYLKILPPFSKKQRHGLQNTTLTSCCYKKYLSNSDVYILLWKYFSRQIYSYSFHICKLNNLKVIDDLYSQCLTQTLS